MTSAPSSDHVPAHSPRWPVALFDLDGTLVNTVPLIIQSYQVAHREVLGQELDAALIRSWIGRTLDDVYVDFAPHQTALIEAYRRFNLAHLEELQQDYVGIPELLAALDTAGVATGIVTSKSRPTAERSLVASGLEGAIPLLTTQLDTPLHKPHPDPLLHALDQLGRRPADAVYVGDSAWDLEAAKAAGVAAIGVTWGAATRADLEATAPLAVVDTPDQLRQLLLPGSVIDA